MGMRPFPIIIINDIYGIIVHLFLVSILKK